ncbi:MAG: hypothetical protein EU551_01990 [Promethearchaeota archaeon]|nr:MAG: hypothetical protein EU551_01990 [Candidatus Lokiarchaeota archaeon]
MKLYTLNYKTTFSTILLVFALFCPIILMGSMVGLPSIAHTSQNLIISKQEVNTGYILEWNRTYGTTFHDYGNGLCVDNNNNVYLVGNVYNTSQSAYDAFIIKYDWSGAQLLEINYDFNGLGDGGNDVAVDSSGNIFLTGYTEDGSVGGTSQDSILIKYNSLGVKQPSWHIGSTYGDSGNAVETDASDNIYMVGHLGTASDGSDLMLRKYDSAFTHDWGVSIGGGSNDVGNDVTIDSNGDVYVVGYTESWGAGGSDILIAKYNSLGTKQWNDTFGWTSSEEGKGIVIDTDQCIVASNTAVFYGSTYTDITFARIWKNTGTTPGWAHFRGSSEDFAYGIDKDSNGDFLLCGSTYSYGEGNYDAIVIKYNSSYSYMYNFTFGTSSYDNTRGIALDGNDNIYIAGSTQGFGAGNSDAYLAKFGIDEDNDGLTHDQEVYTYFTNPCDADHDNDGYTDGAEVDAGTNPLDPNDYPGATTTTEIPGFDLITVLITLMGVIGLLTLTFKLKAQQKIKF